MAWYVHMPSTRSRCASMRQRVSHQHDDTSVLGNDTMSDHFATNACTFVRSQLGAATTVSHSSPLHTDAWPHGRWIAGEVSVPARGAWVRLFAKSHFISSSHLRFPQTVCLSVFKVREMNLIFRGVIRRRTTNPLTALGIAEANRGNLRKHYVKIMYFALFSKTRT